MPGDSFPVSMPTRRIHHEEITQVEVIAGPHGAPYRSTPPYESGRKSIPDLRLTAGFVSST